MENSGLTQTHKIVRPHRFSETFEFWADYGQIWRCGQMIFVYFFILFLGWSSPSPLLAAEFPQRYRLNAAQVFSQATLTAYDLNLISEILSFQRERLQSLFKQADLSVPDIYVYASSQAFESDLGVAWTIGGLSQGTTIYLKPIALLKQTEQLEPLLKHEYTHLFLEQRFPTLPLFLNEGTSAFLSGLTVPSAQPLPYAELLGCQEDTLLNTPGVLLVYLASARYFVADVAAELGIEGFVAWLENTDLKSIEARYRTYYCSVSQD
jgi:hypothetical protein